MTWPRAVHRTLAATSAAATLQLIAVLGLAYCPTRTCDPSETDCATDKTGCIVEGETLHWSGGATSMAVDSGGSMIRDLSSSQTESALQNAFEAWMSAQCEDGHPPMLDIRVAGVVAGEGLGYDDRPGAENINVVAYRDDGWPAAYDSNAIALTTMTFETMTGRIVDSDIELNSAYPLSLADEFASVDLQAVLTHEVGHVLGLAHSDVPNATMTPEQRGAGFAQLRSLEGDDEAGICSIYGPAGNGGCTCRTALVPGDVRASSGFGLLALAVFGWRVRRRGLRHRV